MGKNAEMNPSYEYLVTSLADAARTAEGELGSASGHPDLEQGAGHLHTVLDMLERLDPEVAQSPSKDASLSHAAAIAAQVSTQVIDLTSDGGVAAALSVLDVVVSEVQGAGYVAPDPDDLEWFGGAVPADGTEF